MFIKIESSEKKFDELKHKVNQLIETNLFREVKPTTKYNVSGIYMIYIDNFTSNKIIPVYIGQSKDIQKRYKEHYSEILALNRLSYDEYFNYFFSKRSSFYEGNFKSCKIFKFMIENNCTLDDYHMIIVEETEIENLFQKEEEYFQLLLPSFFGFNQLNSFLKSQSFGFQSTRLDDTQINEYLDLLIEDVNCIYSYYEYGFTRFNFEHSFPKDISFLLNISESFNKKTSIKFDNVNSKMQNLLKSQTTNFDELQILTENEKKSRISYIVAERDYHDNLKLLEEEVKKKFKELKFYSEKAINNFITSINDDTNPKYKEDFYKYVNSKKCNLDFYKTFDTNIKSINQLLEEYKKKRTSFKVSSELLQTNNQKIKQERYKLIFPSSKFNPFALGSSNHNILKLKINEELNLSNTLHILIYISNNALNKNFEIRKDPFIIRIDYCYIDTYGNRTERKYYIDNETTKHFSSGIEYFEKNFYDLWAIRPERFKISSLINNEIDNSFISVLSEYKHGINDYSLKDKSLTKLSIVIKEIFELVDKNTRFNINATESSKVIEKCIVIENIEKNWFIDKLCSNRLPKISNTTTIKKSNQHKSNKIKTVPIKQLNEDNKMHRAEAYGNKVLKKSSNTIDIFNYISSKEKVTAKCKTCGHTWEIRSDHLLSRPYCPMCRKN